MPVKEYVDCCTHLYSLCYREQSAVSGHDHSFPYATVLTLLALIPGEVLLKVSVFCL